VVERVAILPGGFDTVDTRRSPVVAFGARWRQGCQGIAFAL